MLSLSSRLLPRKSQGRRSKGRRAEKAHETRVRSMMEEDTTDEKRRAESTEPVLCLVAPEEEAARSCLRS